MNPSPSGIGIYTTFLHSKNNGLQQRQAPSPAGEGWGEENKINWLYSPSSQPSPSREKERPLVLIPMPSGRGRADIKGRVISCPFLNAIRLKKLQGISLRQLEQNRGYSVKTFNGLTYEKG
jgi:hypothetical protein